MNASADEPLVHVSNLAAGYFGVPVVRDLAMEAHTGEIVALLGPNGAGKTTTLLTLSGLLEPITGDVRVLGEQIDGAGSALAARLSRKGLARVPDDRGLFASLTVQENLRVATGQRRPATDEIFDLFPALGKILNRRAGLLSGGEQQMLGIARALVRRPKLLMVDELSLGLAPILVEQLMPTMRTIAETTGCGVLMVEQHVHLALDVADRAYVLSHGDLVLEGTADLLRDDHDGLRQAYLGG